MQSLATLSPRPKMSEDVIPFTEYRRNLSECCERTKRTHRPLFITQNGRATTVVMNIAEYEEREELFAEWQASMKVLISPHASALLSDLITALWN